jgi:hypothetical protein
MGETMKEKIFLLLAISLFFSSCKDADSPIVSNNKESIFLNGSYYNLLLNFDNADVIGFVEVGTIYKNEYVFEFGGTGSYQPYQGRSYDATAYIANVQKTGFVSLEPARILFNCFHMQEYGKGHYYIPSSWNITNNFGSGYNKIQIDSNQYFNKLDDSVAFGSPVSVTNINLGQVVSRNQDFIIDVVSGSPVVEYSLHLIDKEYNTDTIHANTEVSAMRENDGNMVIEKSVMESMKSGYYSLTVWAYEPKYVTLSNGKKICMLGKSAYKTTIQIN